MIPLMCYIVISLIVMGQEILIFSDYRFVLGVLRLFVLGKSEQL